MQYCAIPLRRLANTAASSVSLNCLPRSHPALRNCAAMSSTSTQSKQLFDYFLVLDFEATCDLDSLPEPQEIIEWPTLKLNARTLEVESSFHRYIRPTHHPTLSHFCTDLTGIVQGMVDGESTFPDVLSAFEAWLAAEGLGSRDSFAFVTCGDWDLKSIFRRQVGLYPELSIPVAFDRWVNVKKPFSRSSGTWPKGMMHMLEIAGLPHRGRHHSGIDDAANIADIVRWLVQRDQVLKLTQDLSVRPAAGHVTVTR